MPRQNQISCPWSSMFDVFSDVFNDYEEDDGDDDDYGGGGDADGDIYRV